MKKRAFALLLALLMAFAVVSVAMADPEEECPHTDTYSYFDFEYGDEENPVTYTSVNNRCHIASGMGYTYTYCSDCGQQVSKSELYHKEREEWHYYNEDGVCQYCGHENTCTHEITEEDSWFDDSDAIEYAPLNEKYHTATGKGRARTVCSDCGQTLEESHAVDELVKQEEHEFDMDGVCKRCEYVNPCPHTHIYNSWRWTDGNNVQYADKNDKYHTSTGRGYTYSYCGDCGQIISKNPEEILVEEQWHEYVDGVCEYCGHENTCTHEHTREGRSWTDWDSRKIEDTDARVHTITGTGYISIYCDDCGMELSRGEATILTEEEDHDFRNGVCADCGHVNTCTHENAEPDYSWADWDNVTYTDTDDEYHTISGPAYTFLWCPDCGERLDETYVENYERPQSHRYDETGVCEYCDHVNTCTHPDAVEDWAWTDWDEVEVEDTNDRYHTVTGKGYTYMYCPDCDTTFDKGPEETMSRQETHWFVDGVCEYCGHVNTCTHPRAYEDWSWTDLENVKYTDKNDKYHTATGKGYSYMYCPDCDAMFDEGPEETRSRDEEHWYENGVCRRCDHVNACQHTNVSESWWWADYDSVIFTPVDAQYHQASGAIYTYKYCRDCGETVEESELMPDVVKKERHDFDANGVCRQCSYENNCQHTDTYTSWEFTNWSDLTYKDKNNKYHTATGKGYMVVYCSDCGQLVERGPGEVITQDLTHDYDAKGVCANCGHKNTCKHPNAFKDYYFEDYDTRAVTSTATGHTISGGAGYTYMWCPDCYRQWDVQRVENLVWTEPHHFRSYTIFNEGAEPTITKLDEFYHLLTAPGYTCDICYQCGYEKNKVESDKATLKLAHTFDENGVCTVCKYKKATVKGMTIEENPQGAQVPNGGKATFTVKVKGKGVSYQWYSRKNVNAKWTKIKKATKAKLTVKAKPSLDGYQYMCEVSNGKGKLTTNAVFLTVYYYPPVIATQPEDATVNNGETATFAVEAQGEGLSYKWSYRKSATAKWTEVKKATKATLTVAAKPGNDGYQYKCDVSNKDGKVTTEVATLHVTLHPPVTVCEPEDVHVKAGEEATFTFDVEGSDLTYAWSYRKSAKAKWTKIKGATGAQLTVTGKADNAGYQYRCEVKNADGSVTSKAVTLDVEYHLAEITLQPKGVKAKKNAKVTFTVEAEDPYEGELTFQWYYRKSSKAKWTKIKGATEAAYSFKATAKKNGYQYKCDITNHDGTISTKAVTLKVK